MPLLSLPTHVLLVLFGMRIELFVLSNFWISAAITIVWVVMLTNSLNFNYVTTGQTSA